MGRNTHFDAGYDPRYVGARVSGDPDELEGRDPDLAAANQTPMPEHASRALRSRLGELAMGVALQEAEQPLERPPEDNAPATQVPGTMHQEQEPGEQS